MIRTARTEMEIKTTKFKDGVTSLMSSINDRKEKLKWQ
jgi:hypothetical protein